jgi:putative DNA primase/helicase
MTTVDWKARRDERQRERAREQDRASERDYGENVTPLWLGQLIRSESGPRDLVANVSIILATDPAFAGNIRLDEMFSALFCRRLPWYRFDEWREWTDVDDIELANWAQLRTVPLKPATCAAGVAMVASRNRHHAVREYLDGLIWDGTPRLDSLLPTYFCATDADPDYLRAIGAAWMISAVARAYEPGCKADHALILEGAQGIFKSTALRALTGSQWFADEIADLGTKDSTQDLRGKWQG